MEAREPQRPSMEGVGSFPGERGRVRPPRVSGGRCSGAGSEGTALGSPARRPSFLERWPFAVKPGNSTWRCHAQSWGQTLYCNRQFLSLSPPEGYMFPGSEEEKSVHLPLLTSWSHYLPHSWLLMQPLWYCSSIINNYVVLMSVGFTTWVGKLNGTCYTSLHLEF